MYAKDGKGNSTRLSESSCQTRLVCGCRQFHAVSRFLWHKSNIIQIYSTDFKGYTWASLGKTLENISTQKCVNWASFAAKVPCFWCRPKRHGFHSAWLVGSLGSAETPWTNLEVFVLTTPEIRQISVGPVNSWRIMGEAPAFCAKRSWFCCTQFLDTSGIASWNLDSLKYHSYPSSAKIKMPDPSWMTLEKFTTCGRVVTPNVSSGMQNNTSNKQLLALLGSATLECFMGKPWGHHTWLLYIYIYIYGNM